MHAALSYLLSIQSLQGSLTAALNWHRARNAVLYIGDYEQQRATSLLTAAAAVTITSNLVQLLYHV